MDIFNGTATFVLPHWRNDNAKSKIYLDETIDGIFRQTDENWNIVIIDDLSPCDEARNYLTEVKKRNPSKINIIYKKANDGPGPGRNLGIEWAHAHNSPIILFNDIDDISHYKRLETVRRILFEDPDAGVVYSSFQIIDENSKIVPRESINPSILGILEIHEQSPVQGYNVWIDIGIKKGYTNLTSSTAVKTEIAYRYPFPAYRISEDQHAWLRYSAGGAKFVYAPEIPSLYRIESQSGTASQERMKDFYHRKVVADTEGFREAIRIAVENKSIRIQDRDDLLIKFHIKLAEIVAKENEIDLARQQLGEALKISERKTKALLMNQNSGSLLELLETA